MPWPDVQTAAPGEIGLAQLYRTIAATLDVVPEELTEESSPDTVSSWDSLNHLNIVMALEEEFGIALSAEDVMAMRNIGLICTTLRERGANL